MRVLIVNDYNLSMLGGGEVHIKGLLELLNTHGVETDFISGDIGDKSFKSIYNIGFKKKFLEYISDKSYDVIHIHSLSRNISISFLSSIKRRGIPIVMTIHSFVYNCPKTFGIKKGEICFNKSKINCLLSHCSSFSLKKGLLKTLEDSFKVVKINFHKYYLGKYVNIFICPSQKLRNSVKELFNFDKEKVVYIPNFIDIPNGYSPDFSVLNPHQLLFVGRLSREKGVDVSIRAIHSILEKNPDTKILYDIIGDGPEKEDLAKLIQSLGLENHISLLGKIDNSNLSDYYNRAGIILMPSVWLENNPLVALEAMKAGKPILTSNVGGFPDLVEDGRNGYLFKMGNHIDLAEKIELLLGDKEKLIEMGEYGFGKVKKEFNSDLFYKRIMAAYTD